MEIDLVEGPIAIVGRCVHKGLIIGQMLGRGRPARLIIRFDLFCRMPLWVDPVCVLANAAVATQQSKEDRKDEKRAHQRNIQRR